MRRAKILLMNLNKVNKVIVICMAFTYIHMYVGCAYMCVAIYVCMKLSAV